MRFEEGLTNPHPAIRKLLQADEKRAAKSALYSWSWDKPLFASGFETRRLRLLNSLALGLARSGGRFDVRGQSGRESTAHVGVMHLELRLDHPAAKPTRHGEWETREGPADTLQLAIG